MANDTFDDESFKMLADLIEAGGNQCWQRDIELRNRVDGLRRQVAALWAGLAVLAVAVVAASWFLWSGFHGGPAAS